MKRLGILASHQGTNFQAIIDACCDGRLCARPVVAISNNSKSFALKRARQAGIDTVHLSCKTHPEPAQLDEAILASLCQHQVDFVITAGYMKKLGPQTISHYTDRILNIHPALLPRHGGKGMYGMNVHKAVIASGDSVTGITIHWVDADYDAGAVIKQHVIPISVADTPESLAERVRSQEHELLINALSGILE